MILSTDVASSHIILVKKFWFESSSELLNNRKKVPQNFFTLMKIRSSKILYVINPIHILVHCQPECLIYRRRIRHHYIQKICWWMEAVLVKLIEDDNLDEEMGDDERLYGRQLQS